MQIDSPLRRRASAQNIAPAHPPSRTTCSSPAIHFGPRAAPLTPSRPHPRRTATFLAPAASAERETDNSGPQSQAPASLFPAAPNGASLGSSQQNAPCHSCPVLDRPKRPHPSRWSQKSSASRSNRRSSRHGTRLLPQPPAMQTLAVPLQQVVSARASGSLKKTPARQAQRPRSFVAQSHANRLRFAR